MCWSAFSVFIIALISHIVNLNSPALIKLAGDFLLYKTSFEQVRCVDLKSK